MVFKVALFDVQPTKRLQFGITAGEVPTHWKKDIDVPIIKKGDATDKNNYKPVSCLVTASKVLKKKPIVKLYPCKGLLRKADPRSSKTNFFLTFSRN